MVGNTMLSMEDIDDRFKIVTNIDVTQLYVSLFILS